METPSSVMPRHNLLWAGWAVTIILLAVLRLTVLQTVGQDIRIAISFVYLLLGFLIVTCIFAFHEDKTKKHLRKYHPLRYQALFSQHYVREGSRMLSFAYEHEPFDDPLIEQLLEQYKHLFVFTVVFVISVPMVFIGMLVV